MSADNFAASLADVEVTEGGFCDNPHDPGGATENGITQHQYDLWRIAHGQPTQNVRLLGPEEESIIYRSCYWNPVNGDALPAGVDYCVFDFAVNSGPHKAAVSLQFAVGVKLDGQIGDKTLAAVAALDPLHIINSVCDQRLAYMKGLKNWPFFEHGWSARVASVEQIARGMA